MCKITQTVLVIITMILTGCVRVTPVSLGDGRNAYELSCPGGARSYADCRNKAAEVCGGNYRELDKEEFSSLIPNYSTGTYMQGRSRRMTVVCK